MSGAWTLYQPDENEYGKCTDVCDSYRDNNDRHHSSVWDPRAN